MENIPSFDTMPRMLAELMEQMTYITRELSSMSKNFNMGQSLLILKIL